MWPWESYQWASVFLIYQWYPQGYWEDQVTWPVSWQAVDNQCSAPAAIGTLADLLYASLVSFLLPSLQQLFQTVSKHICPKKLPALLWASCQLLSCPLASCLQGDVSPLLPMIHSHVFFVWSSIRLNNCSVTDPPFISCLQTSCSVLLSSYSLKFLLKLHFKNCLLNTKEVWSCLKQTVECGHKYPRIW